MHGQLRSQLLYERKDRRKMVNRTGFVLSNTRWFCLLLICLLASLGLSLAFVSPISRRTLSLTTAHNVKLSKSCLGSMPVASTDEASGDAVALKDASGNEITEGALVRVVKGGLKAYHITRKGQGSYDENKKFVPAPEGGDRGTKNLVVPVGLRGVVTRVYDVHDISANLPITVKFVPGKHVEEGFDAPVVFIMHFHEYEVECV